MECPFRCSQHTFPNHFCPYCGSKLVTVYGKKDLLLEFPELQGLVEED